MSATTDRYRNWLWAYPPSWREKHGDAVTGILAESAVAGDRPGARDWLNLAWSGLAARLHNYGSGVAERGSEAVALLRAGLASAALPAIISAVVLLVIDAANGLAGTQSSVGYAANVDSVWWAPSRYDDPRSFFLGGFVVLVAGVAALGALRSRRRNLARAACGIGAAVGVLVWFARLLAGQGSAVSVLTPAPDTALVAGVLLALGTALPLEARATRGQVAFGTLLAILLAFDSGLLGGAVDIGALNSAIFPTGGAAFTGCLLLFSGLRFIAASRDRLVGLLAVAVLAVCWRAGLSTIARDYQDVIAGRMLLEGLAVVAAVLLAVTLAAQPAHVRREAS